MAKGRRSRSTRASSSRSGFRRSRRGFTVSFKQPNFGAGAGAMHTAGAAGRRAGRLAVGGARTAAGAAVAAFGLGVATARMKNAGPAGAMLRGIGVLGAMSGLREARRGVRYAFGRAAPRAAPRAGPKTFGGRGAFKGRGRGWRRYIRRGGRR